MKSIFVLLFIGIPGLVFAQKFNLQNIHAKQIAAVQAGDKARRVTPSYSIGVAEDYFPNRSKFLLAQPIIYSRPDSSFVFETEYFFSKSDSVVRLIEYQWEGTENTTAGEFDRRVEQNAALITRALGKPKKDIPETDDKAAKTVWFNDKVHVEQLMMPGLMRIRVLVSWK